MEENCWYKVVLETTIEDSEIIDLATDLFFELGSIGVEVEYANRYLENKVKLFGEIFDERLLNSDDRNTEIIAYFNEPIELNHIQLPLASIFDKISFSISQQKQINENWHSQWMAHYTPQKISRFLTIVPIWMEKYQKSEHEKVVFLDPGVAFGTGNHPTTQLGAQALEIVMQGGETVLDVGTGSGILSFVAKLFGADKVYGFDLDPQAVESAKQNLMYQTNKEGIKFSVNNLLSGIEERADIIVANILPHILIEMLNDAHKLLKDDGWLILGGILQEKSSDLEQALIDRGWHLYQKTMMGDWVSLLLKKQEID